MHTDLSIDYPHTISKSNHYPVKFVNYPHTNFRNMLHAIVIGLQLWSRPDNRNNIMHYFWFPRNLVHRFEHNRCFMKDDRLQGHYIQSILFVVSSFRTHRCISVVLRILKRVVQNRLINFCFVFVVFLHSQNLRNLNKRHRAEQQLV